MTDLKMNFGESIASINAVNKIILGNYKTNIDDLLLNINSISNPDTIFDKKIKLADINRKTIYDLSIEMQRLVESQTKIYNSERALLEDLLEFSSAFLATILVALEI